MESSDWTETIRKALSERCQTVLLSCVSWKMKDYKPVRMLNVESSAVKRL